MKDTRTIGEKRKNKHYFGRYFMYTIFGYEEITRNNGQRV